MENPLCKYKDIIGKPGTGIHAYRFYNIAILDVIITLIGALFISWVIKVSPYYVVPIVFLSGILAHRIFCVRTQVDKLLFSE